MTDYWLYIRVFGPIPLIIALLCVYLSSPLLPIAQIILVFVGALMKDALDQPVRATLHGLKPAVIDSWLKELSNSSSEIDALDRELESMKLERVEASGESFQDLENMVRIINRRQIILDSAIKIVGRISSNLDDYGEVDVLEIAEQFKAAEKRQRELREALMEKPEDGDDS